VRGIVRRTTLKDYLAAEPKWETMLDYDALSKADKQSWVGEGLTCLEPENELCLVQLSAGGEDAETLREMDLNTGNFVPAGFVLPRGKQAVTWVDKDTLLIARDWGPGTIARPVIRSPSDGGSAANHCKAPRKYSAETLRITAMAMIRSCSWMDKATAQ